MYDVQKPRVCGHVRRTEAKGVRACTTCRSQGCGGMYDVQNPRVWGHVRPHVVSVRKNGMPAVLATVSLTFDCVLFSPSCLAFSAAALGEAHTRSSSHTAVPSSSSTTTAAVMCTVAVAGVGFDIRTASHSFIVASREVSQITLWVLHWNTHGSAGLATIPGCLNGAVCTAASRRTNADVSRQPYWLRALACSRADVQRQWQT